MATAIMKQKEVPEMDDVEEVISKISESLQTASNTKENLDDSAGKIRINIVSFEKWYANQIKYHKVTGEEPGKKLKSC